MQVSFVMMVVLSGLGCQNKTSVVVDTSPSIAGQIEYSRSGTDPASDYSTLTYSGSFAASAYPEIPSRIYPSIPQPASPNWHAGLRSTLYSFVLGRDPDVSTVREIEASVYGVDSGW